MRYPSATVDSRLEYLATGVESVEGWFYPVDQRLFVAIDDVQREAQTSGDLLEVGAYLGRSAILLGFMRRNEEQVAVCDTFGGGDPLDPYPDLTEAKFRENWGRFHASPPRVLHGMSDVALDQVADSSCRFVHVDGSHQYDAVCTDIQSAKRVLVPGGVVVFDDVFSSHTPGVPAAVWAAVADGMRPLAISNKLYATWGDVSALSIHDAVDDVAVLGEYDIAGARVFRFGMPKSRLAGWIPPKAVPFARRMRAHVKLPRQLDRSRSF